MLNRHGGDGGVERRQIEVVFEVRQTFDLVREDDVHGHVVVHVLELDDLAVETRHDAVSSRRLRARHPHLARLDGDVIRQMEITVRLRREGLLPVVLEGDGVDEHQGGAGVEGRQEIGNQTGRLG